MADDVHFQIVPRKGPDFDLDGDIPRFWLDGDPFRTRFFDAMSTLFPEGERFFIACVRDYRDGVNQAELAAAIKDFIFQEGQHGQIHTQFNARLQAQGIKVDRILANQRHVLFDYYRKRFPKRFTLAMTAASEHVTAMLAHAFFTTGVLRPADRRMRALYAWHAVEEIEHKAVAFDVFVKIARGNYPIRVAAMLLVAVMFPLHTLLIVRHMLTVDGYGGDTRMWLRGLWWVFGPRGVFTGQLGHLLAYFRPGFHPNDAGDLAGLQHWLEVFESTGGDALAAGDAVLAPEPVAPAAPARAAQA